MWLVRVTINLARHTRQDSHGWVRTESCFTTPGYDLLVACLTAVKGDCLVLAELCVVPFWFNEISVLIRITHAQTIKSIFREN